MKLEALGSAVFLAAYITSAVTAQTVGRVDSTGDKKFRLNRTLYESKIWCCPTPALLWGLLLL